MDADEIPRAMQQNPEDGAPLERVMAERLDVLRRNAVDADGSCAIGEPHFGLSKLTTAGRWAQRGPGGRVRRARKLIYRNASPCGRAKHACRVVRGRERPMARRNGN